MCICIHVYMYVDIDNDNNNVNNISLSLYIYIYIQYVCLVGVAPLSKSRKPCSYLAPRFPNIQSYISKGI